MDYLYKIFNKLDHFSFTKEYERRLSFDSVKQFDLSMKPINQAEVFELYYIPTNNIVDAVAKIYKVSKELMMIFSKLPNVAKDQFILESIVEELFHTNELEGVRSSKAEIANSVRNIEEHHKEKQRFESMILQYKNLMFEQISLPASPRDIRNMYDRITAGEIDDSNLPDGSVFRKGPTHVLAQSGSGKVIHRGVMPEDKIIQAVERLLQFMNEADDVPELIKIAIGHYYFGYIHPFYDGNGRTSRFISSLYLANELGNVASLSLSRGCNKMKVDYLKAFEITNSVRNKGEMNFFIDTFLYIILNTLEEMKNELKEKMLLLDSVNEKISRVTHFETKNEVSCLFILAQHHFFGFTEGMTTKELADVMDLSQNTIRKITKHLLDKSFIKQKGVRPAYFSIDEDFLESE